MKKIALLGSTGSIGRQVLQVADRYPEEYKIVSLCAGSNAKLLQEQIQKYKPSVAGLSDPQNARYISELPQKTTLYCGEKALLHCVTEEADIVFVAVVGFCGLQAVLQALGQGKQVALANKEALVAGGALVMPLAKSKNLNIIPVDSEHSAIWQCLSYDFGRPFKRIILTASGGALRDAPIEELPSVTPEIALKHPNWQMGAKITIDCATMFNKGLEVIEAMWLFNAELEKIKVLIHPQSIIHSMVEYADNAVIAQLANPSMEIPIQLALNKDDRKFAGVNPLDFTASPMTFYEVDYVRYPCFSIALQAAKAGGVMPCAVSGANEEAVKLFLNKKIKFTQIADCISYAADKCVNMPVTYENLLLTDFNARRAVFERVRVLEK